jgi:hypothetical protein
MESASCFAVRFLGGMLRVRPDRRVISFVPIGVDVTKSCARGSCWNGVGLVMGSTGLKASQYESWGHDCTSQLSLWHRRQNDRLLLHRSLVHRRHFFFCLMDGILAKVFFAGLPPGLTTMIGRESEPDTLEEDECDGRGFACRFDILSLSYAFRSWKRWCMMMRRVSSDSNIQI